MHDSFIRTRGRGPIALDTLALEELLELEKHGELVLSHPQMRITRLEEALEAASGFRAALNLDLKDDRSIAVLCVLSANVRG
jgi:hypothetical protein